MNFTVHSLDGSTIALVACPVEALRINRTTPGAHYVLRVADGALIAQKARKGHGPFLLGVLS